MRKRFTCKWAGSFKIFLAALIVLTTSPCFSMESEELPSLREPAREVEWEDYVTWNNRMIARDRTEGISYIISGSIGLVGGLVGSGVTSDPLEKGVYALFETIGIASIGYGAYKWQVGDSQRLFISSLRDTRELTPQQKLAFLRTYELQKKESEKRERLIKSITHGLIAALNFYSAYQQKENGGVKNALIFVGGANLLASISYTF